MDKAIEEGKLIEAKAHITAWLNHPITREIYEDNAEQQQALINLILENPVVGVETFFAREQALGHLRGLRRWPASIQGKLDEIEEQLRDIKQ